MSRNQALYEAVTRGDRKGVQAQIQQALAGAVGATELLNDSMIPAMRDVGERFSRNEVFVPEMLIAARAMQTGLGLIEPLLTREGHQPVARVCIGTVKGDLHDIGKNLVSMMLKGAGFAVDDLGVDCDVAKFAQAVDRGAQVICLSALLTTTMSYMRNVVSHFAGNDKVKIIIGGAPVTQAFADEIGAHGFGADANQAIQAAETCLGIRRG